MIADNVEMRQEMAYKKRKVIADEKEKFMKQAIPDCQSFEDQL